MKSNYPTRINLYTRSNKCETVLDLIDEQEGVYRYCASYPYSITGDPAICIDFSEGPALYLGSKIGNTNLEITEINTSNSTIKVKSNG